MARFEIKSKDGLSVRFSGKPVYNGSYLKPSSLTFSEVNSPTPIAWEVGDCVDYTRTGMRYYLYSIPQPTKRAKMGSRGDAFSYSGVQFFAATKELEIALFKDLVNSDNNIHFSTSPDVATFENVEGVARRIQSCMDYFFPNRWEIRIADFDEVEDAEIIEKINTAKDFALSNGTCLDALSRIYELWQDIGWIHTNENGKEVIIIGYPNKRLSENTTDAFVYGKGNGLTAIKKNQTNREEFATRLYVYGSERNLPARYYNDKDILNAESVDIRNLMLPLDKWGLTDGKPDARKAYLENAEAVAKYGLIPKTHYFDSEEAGADIYPTISGMTIGKIREALTALGQTDSAYFPSAELYPDASQRVDKVRWCDNPDDHGDVGDVLLNGSPSMFDGETKSVDVSSGTRTANIVENKLMASAEFSYSESRTCKARFSTAVSGYVNDDGFEGVVVKMRLSDSNNANSSMSKIVEYPAVLNGGKWEFTLPSVEYDYGQIPKAIFGAYAFLTIAVTLPSGSKDKSISYVLNTGIQQLDLYLIMEKTFLLRLHEIGFDIDKQASLGKGKVISMKTGACAGRSFVIESCRHKGGIYTQGYWDLTLKRQKDNTLGLMFPNVNAQIAEGDEFVLTDIAMPELYVQAAMLRLLSEGQKLLARASSIQNLYEPSIDAKVMIEQGRTLREGMFMEISDADVVDNTTEYILIDTLSIHEDESAIPTYKVTLKERRKVTYKGTPSATSADNTESVEDDVQTEVNIDLSEYAKKAEVEEAFELLSSMWQLDGDTIVATKDVRIKANLIVEQDTSSGGEGQDTPSAGLDENEVLDIVKGYTYSKSEINKLIDDVNAGDIDLTNYYTKGEVDAKIPSLDGYAKTTEVDKKINELNLSQYAKASDLDALQAEVDNIDAVLGLSETAEGYINTWAEVKAFLDGYKNADDLATILSGINADIAKNAENIATLDNDKADKATTLAGYGITDAYTKSDLESYKTWWDAVMGLVVKEGNNIRIKTNLIVEGDTSSGGSGQDTPASGTVTGIKVSASETLTPNNAGIIDMVSVLSSIDVSDQLTAYAKTEDVNAALLTKQDTISDLATIRSGATLGATALQSISKTNVTDALGYTPLSTGGGTLQGDSADLLVINRLSSTSSAYITFRGNNSLRGRIGFDANNNPIVQDINYGSGNQTLYHTGNFNPSDYLPKSGGTITGSFGALTIKRNNAYASAIRLENTSGVLGYIGINDDYNARVWDKNGNDVGILLHSGNYSDYALPKRGGTIEGTSMRPFAVQTSSSDLEIQFKTGDGIKIYLGWNAGPGMFLQEGVSLKYLGIKTDGTPYYYDNSYNTLIHSGNIGSYALKTDGSNAMEAGILWSDYSGFDETSMGLRTFMSHNGTSVDGIFPSTNYGTVLHVSINSSSYAFQLASSVNADGLFYRGYYADNKSWESWKTIAFTDSTVAAANKLATARTIWGQSFDGTGNVSGSLTGTNFLLMDRASNPYLKFTENGLNGFVQFWDGAIFIGPTTTKSLLVNNNGNVLIGTTTDSSSGKLQISGGATLDGYMAIGAVSKIADLGEKGLVVATSSDRSNWGMAMWTEGNGKGYIQQQAFTSAATTYSLCLNPFGGNVGIGNPAPQYKLDVNGEINTNNYAFSKYGYRLTSGTSGLCGLFAEEVIGGNINTDLWLYTTTKANIYAPSGVNIIGSVTMSDELFLGNNKGIFFKNASGTNVLAMYVSHSNVLQVGYNNVDRVAFQKPVTMLSTLSVSGNTEINGNLVVSGDTSSGSDIRFKDVIKNKTIKIEHIAKAPLFTFKWNDREDDTIHLGSSAQYWEKVTPWLVKGENFKTLDYSTLGVAMGISLAKKAVNHEERIQELERKVKSLEEENRRLRYGN